MEQVARCNWDSPGHNPFMGEVVPAIDRYTDIPTPVRMRLKQRMQKRQYDDLVDIRRDSITGRHQYEPKIRDMHFGLDRVCKQVTRENWSAKMQERGLVYCEAEHCILVPTVCRNVSRIERRPSDVAATQEGPTLGQTPTATSSDSVAGDPTPTATSSTAIAVAPAQLSDDRPTGPSFAEGVTGTALPLWPTPGGDVPTLDSMMPPTGAGPGGAASGPWIAVAGGGGGGGGGGGPLLGGEPGGSGDAPFGRPGGPSLGDPPILTDPVGGRGPVFVPGGPGDGAGQLPVSPVPEPSTWLSLLIGLAALAGATARRRRAATQA